MGQKNLKKTGGVSDVGKKGRKTQWKMGKPTPGKPGETKKKERSGTGQGEQDTRNGITCWGTV